MATGMEQSYRILHQRDTDEQLRSVILTNLTKIATMPTNVTQSQLADMKMLKAEADVCQSMLNEREGRRQREEKAQKKAVEEWKINLPYRIRKAFLQLPAASGRNGQIVAAILEEEPMTAAEIQGFCEELEALGDEEFAALLEELEKEQIIRKGSEGRYFLRNLCLEDLMQPDPVEAGMEEAERQGICGDGYTGRKHKEICKAVLTLLRSGPAQTKELVERITDKESEDREFLVEMGILQEDGYYRANEIRYTDIKKLADAGILSVQPANASPTLEDTLLSYALLGEKNTQKEADAK